MAVQVAGPALFRRPGCSDPPSHAVGDATTGKNEPETRVEEERRTGNRHSPGKSKTRQRDKKRRSMKEGRAARSPFPEKRFGERRTSRSFKQIDRVTVPRK